MINKQHKLSAWKRRKKRIRKKIFGTAKRPRLTVYKSLKHIYAQIIDDSVGQTLVSASTLSKEFESSNKSRKNIDAAKKVGELLALKAKKLNIETITFDRNGYLFHGRIKNLAKSCNENGLKF